LVSFWLFFFWLGFFVVWFAQSLPKISLLWRDESVSRNLEVAIGYAKFFSRSHDAVIRVYDAAGNVIETHEHRGDFQRVVSRFIPITSHFSLKGQCTIAVDALAATPNAFLRPGWRNWQTRQT
jgi:hypothetical protein